MVISLCFWSFCFSSYTHARTQEKIIIIIIIIKSLASLLNRHTLTPSQSDTNPHHRSSSAVLWGNHPTSPVCTTSRTRAIRPRLIVPDKNLYTVGRKLDGCMDRTPDAVYGSRLYSGRPISRTEHQIESCMDSDWVIDRQYTKSNHIWIPLKSSSEHHMGYICRELHILGTVLFHTTIPTRHKFLLFFLFLFFNPHLNTTIPERKTELMAVTLTLIVYLPTTFNEKAEMRK